MEIAPIGHIESPYPTKFGVPRQPGLVPSLVSWLVLDSGAPRAQAAGTLESLEAGERIWLTWSFSRNLHADGTWSPTVRPPRLGGNRRVGVFATRSSFRPNGLAISTVRVSQVERPNSDAGAPARIAFTGGDMVDGTPVYALRPYDRRRDCLADAAGGWVERNDWPMLRDVEVPAQLLAMIPESLRAGLRELLLQDPRPAYTRATQPDREFWIPLAHQVIWFRVDGKTARVTRVRELDEAAYHRLKTEGTI